MLNFSKKLIATFAIFMSIACSKIFTNETEGYANSCLNYLYVALTDSRFTSNSLQNVTSDIPKISGTLYEPIIRDAMARTKQAIELGQSYHSSGSGWGLSLGNFLGGSSSGKSGGMAPATPFSSNAPVNNFSYAPTSSNTTGKQGSFVPAAGGFSFGFGSPSNGATSASFNAKLAQLDRAIEAYPEQQRRIAEQKHLEKQNGNQQNSGIWGTFTSALSSGGKTDPQAPTNNTSGGYSYSAPVSSGVFGTPPTTNANRSYGSRKSSSPRNISMTRRFLKFFGLVSNGKKTTKRSGRTRTRYR